MKNIDNMTKDELVELKEKIVKVNKSGKILSSISTVTFVGTLLSPFDFEGPIAEIASAILVATGSITVVITKNKINNIELRLQK